MCVVALGRPGQGVLPRVTRSGAHLISRSQTFNGQCRDFLGIMCNQRLDSVDVLLARLVSHSDLDAEVIASQGARTESLDDDLTWDLLYEQGFDVRLRTYLSGVGHPRHPNVIAAIGVERFEREANDPLLRARLFLRMMTGSDLIPLDPEWSIKVRFLGLPPRRQRVLTSMHRLQVFYEHGDGARRVAGSRMVLDAPIPAPVRHSRTSRRAFFLNLTRPPRSTCALATRIARSRLTWDYATCSARIRRVWRLRLGCTGRYSIRQILIRRRFSFCVDPALAMKLWCPISSCAC